MLRSPRLIAAAFLFSATPIALCALEPTIENWKFGLGAKGSSNDMEYDALFSVMDADVLEVWYNTNDVYVKANSIPSHPMGPWDPRTDYPTEQNNTWKFSRVPSPSAGSGDEIGLAAIAIFVNGVQIFNWWDGTSYEDEDRCNYLAPVNRPDVDDDGGHPAPPAGAMTREAAEGHTHAWTKDATHTHGAVTTKGTLIAAGAYHYHTYAQSLGDQLGDNGSDHSPIIGFAFDGNPIYGPYGYTNTDGTGPIKRMESSYQLRTSMTQRDSLPDGTILAMNEWGPAINGMNPLGTFAEDYEYVDMSGDLDEHNGRFCDTPEYPSGVYAYFCTLDGSLDPYFPYTIGPNEFYGPVISENLGMGAGNVMIPGGTTQFNPASSVSEWTALDE